MFIIERKDAFEVLDEIENKSVDLFILDPPYNLGKVKWDLVSDYGGFRNLLLQKVSEKLKPSGSAYFFNTAFNSALFVADSIQYSNLKFRQWITWYKVDAAGNPTRLYHNAQETILFYTGASDDYTFNRDAVRIPYTTLVKQRYKNRSATRKWDLNPKGALCKDVWEILSDRHWHRKGMVGTRKGKHPTIKPVELIRRIVLASSNEGDYVVDPFLGTGTSAVVCQSLNREFRGCDVNDIDIAHERLKQTVI